MLPNLFNRPSQPQPKTPMQERAVMAVEELTEPLPTMMQPILKTYLPQLWDKLDDEKIVELLDHMRRIADHIQYGDGGAGDGET